jgi:hypothetical protein
VYLPAGAYRGLYASDSATPRGSSSYDYYPTRAIVTHSYVPVDSYYGPLCNPRVDSPCQ